jgi:RNA-binding protein with serine-rich domain 1
LFVEKLTRNVTKEHLNEIFGKYGKIKDVELLWDKRANLSKGSSYVEYFERSDAEKALSYLDGVPYIYIYISKHVNIM